MLFFQKIQKVLESPGADREEISSHGLTGRLLDLVVFGVCHGDRTLKPLRHFLSSLGRYGKTPFLVPYYGTSDWPQAFARHASVHGATFVLNWTDRTLEEVERQRKEEREGNARARKEMRRRERENLQQDKDAKEREGDATQANDKDVGHDQGLGDARQNPQPYFDDEDGDEEEEEDDGSPWKEIKVPDGGKRIYRAVIIERYREIEGGDPPADEDLDKPREFE